MTDSFHTLPEEPAWYCVHTRPKSEHIAVASLRILEGEIETYCPRIRFQRNLERGKVWFTEALFPTYVFAKFSPMEVLRGVRYANGVLNVLEFGGVVAPVPEEMIATIREEMGGEDVREVHQEPEEGQEITVSQGPLRGFTGIVTAHLSGSERTRILIEFLGEERVVEVSADDLGYKRDPRGDMGG